MREESIYTEPDVVMCSAASREPIRTMLGELALALRKHLEDPSEEVARCTPCLGKSDNKHLEKFCPGSPFEPSFSPSSWPAPLQHDLVSPARRLTCGPVA